MKNKSSYIIAIVAFLVLECFGMDTWSAITTAASVGVFWDFLYEKLLWKLNPKIPKVYGKYVSTNWSSYNGGMNYQTDIEIFQTASRIIVKETMGNSTCDSLSAELVKMTGNQDWYLFYSYITNPDAASGDAMHLGTAYLRVNNRNELVGSYYTNRTQQTNGTMKLKRVK
jgi:hypothetical protein